MGTGKSSVARTLASKLGRKVLDTDIEVEKKTGIAISEIFSVYGEGYFRKLESEAGELLKNYKPGTLVVATGGGFVISEVNRLLLDKYTVIVLLEASPENIIKRVGKNPKRPLLKGSSQEENIKKLLLEREKYYNRCDLSITTDNKSISTVVDEICEKIFISI